MRSVNHNIEKVKASASMELMILAKRMKSEGIPVVDLSGGEPDFDTPDRIKNAAIDALNKGHTHYAVGKGIIPLREAICNKVKADSNINCDISQVIVTPGGKYGIYMAAGALINPGDEVMILSPYWVSYEAIVKLWGGIPKIVSLDHKKNYKIEEELLYGAVTEKTKLLIINYPNNPTGKILHEEEVQILKQFIMKTGIYVLSDEVYEEIVYDGNKSISLASIPEIFDNIVTVKGFSKGMAMTGWRIGYTIANSQLTDKMYRLFEHSITGVSTFIQEAAVYAFDCKEEIEWMRKQYERRRDYLVKEIDKIPGLNCEKPEGAFYLWLQVDTDKSADEICKLMLDTGQIVGVPGTAYGEYNATYIRCSFANSMEVLQEAVKQIRYLWGEG